MTFDWVQDDLPASDWSALRTQVPAPQRFLTAGWIAPWGRHGLDGGWTGPLRFLVVRDAEGRAAGAFPCASQAMPVGRAVSLAGPYFPFRGLLVAAPRRDEVCGVLADALTQGREAVATRVGLVEADDLAAMALRDALRARGWRDHVLSRAEEFLLELRAGAALEDVVSRKVLKKAAYYERRMGRAGDVRLERFTGLGAEEWRRVIADVGEVEAASWLARHGGDLRFTGERNRRLWSEVLRDPAASASIRVWLLYLDGRPVSHCFTIESGEHRYVLANSYAESVADHRTGSILYRHQLQDAVDAGIRVVNFGQGDSGYKQLWGARPAGALEDWLLFRPGVAGFAADRLLRAYRRLRAHRASTERPA